MTTPAIAPYVPTYANRVPYLTPAEYKAAPTGVDVSQLVPGGAPSQENAALSRMIGRASSWADSLCFQVLAATSDTQAGTYRVKADGTVQVVCDYSPIVYVTAITTGLTPSQLAPLTDLSNVWPQGKVVAFPAPPNVWPTPFVVVSYVNGYANTTLATSAAFGATSISVTSPLGIVPGLPLRIDDGVNPIYVTVDPTYTVGSATVPLTAALPYLYGPGVSVSALPEAIKQATISLTSALIKTRGTQAITMVSMNGGPGELAESQPGGLEDLDVAMDLLAPFVRVI